MKNCMCRCNCGGEEKVQKSIPNEEVSDFYVQEIMDNRHVRYDCPRQSGKTRMIETIVKKFSYYEDFYVMQYHGSYMPKDYCVVLRILIEAFRNEKPVVILFDDVEPSRIDEFFDHISDKKVYSLSFYT